MLAEYYSKKPPPVSLNSIAIHLRKQARYWATKPLLKLAIGTALEIKGSALLKPLAIKGKALKAEILARKGIAILLKVNNEAGTKLERARLEGKEAKELNKTALMLSANAELAKGVPLRREANGIRTIDKLLKEEATKLAELTAAPTVGIAPMILEGLRLITRVTPEQQKKEQNLLLAMYWNLKWSLKC